MEVGDVYILRVNNINKESSNVLWGMGFDQLRLDEIKHKKKVRVLSQMQKLLLMTPGTEQNLCWRGNRDRTMRMSNNSKHFSST
ncbi:CLUMA_CG006133, isoform A [Clunio marinus]|uniref:CLUMA_CG006133, isoform A n=1 Tax=Clunio marinus TaxID=568069 RepID=A0A1J1HWY1_9DIPT|nr:CLUMA_CG006133, isoform A [Clunio marinus]